MAAIYRHVTVNFDHLFAATLRYCPHERIRCDDLHRVIYVAARLLQASGARRRHPSIGDGLLALVTGAGYKPLESAVRLAHQEGLLTVEDGWYVLNRTAIHAEHGFHDVRVKNTLAVVANELEPLRPAIRAVKAALAQARERLADLLVAEDRAEFERDWRISQSDPGERHASAIGAPFVLAPAVSAGALRQGVVACHGYLAAPHEMRQIGEHLAAGGWRVQGARLAGHGTSPAQLGKVTVADWRRSLDRAVAASRAACDRTVLVGFSLGGLLCLDLAARLPHAIAGVVAINVPFVLSDPASRLVPAVDGWNHLAHALHLDRLRFATVPNRPEWPDVNYDSNPVAGIHELERLIAEAKLFLPRVSCPVLLLQSDADPVVVPSGAQEVLRQLGSDDKTLQALHLARHVVVRGEGSDLVAGQVGDFLARISRQW
jgi:esterase/lipase